MGTRPSKPNSSMRISLKLLEARNVFFLSTLLIDLHRRWHGWILACLKLPMWAPLAVVVEPWAVHQTAALNCAQKLVNSLFLFNILWHVVCLQAIIIKYRRKVFITVYNLTSVQPHRLAVLKQNYEAFKRLCLSGIHGRLGQINRGLKE